jgi:transposase
MMRSDALNAFIMTLKDGGNSKVVLLGRQPGWYWKADGLRVEQPMDIENRVKVVGGRPDEYELKWEPKGLKTILEERGLWTKGLKLEDAQNLLNMQPDFQNQMEWLEETVRKHRGLKGEEYYVYFYPKFHPEFNPIERIWGAGKHRLREECQNNFLWLVENFPKFLREIPLPQIQRYFRGARRYWDAYREKILYGDDGQQIGVGTFLTPSQVDFAVKHYKSHRGIPNKILKDFEDLEGEAVVFGYDPLPRSSVDHELELNWNLRDTAPIIAMPAAEGEEDPQMRLNAVKYSSKLVRQERRSRASPRRAGR